jgi:hypothetical protein
VHELVAPTREALTARRVFGGHVERGGAAGGSGQDEGEQRGEDGGFGLVARPVGAHVIKDGAVRWQRALDLNRTIGPASTVAVVRLLSAARRRTGPGPR